MENNNTFRNILIGVGVIGFAYWWFNIRKKSKKVNPQDAIDGKTTFYSKDEQSFVRGYPMPENIESIKPDEKGEILITHKPDNTDVFGTMPSTGAKVTINKETKQIIYKYSPLETWIEEYRPELVSKLVLLDKKYIA